MTQLLDLLVKAVSAQSNDREVALLLSGGIDSVSVGIAAAKAGKLIHAYTFHLAGQPSRDLAKARRAAACFGWSLTVIEVPVHAVADDFLRLAVEQRCKRKTQFEVTFPLLYLLPQITEKEVWSGFNADEHYGNDRECALHQARLKRAGAKAADRKLAFDTERLARLNRVLNEPDSGDTWWYARRLAERHGKRLLDPYLDPAVRKFFLAFDHDQLSPLNKPLVRRELANELACLPRGSLAVGVQLQTGAGVDKVFGGLLKDERINRFDKKYTTISGLCQRWGQEVDKDPAGFRAEVRGLQPQPPARRTDLIAGVYRPYRMAEVLRLAIPCRGVAIEAFAGGAGSGTGLHRAGYRVAVANEFVAEAARTYRTNFPGVPVDEQDIREIVASATAVETFLARGGLQVGEADLLSGSPPCAEYSLGGRGLSDQSRLRSYSDKMQSGVATLIFDYFKLAKMAMPKVVVAENVPALPMRYPALFRRAVDCLRFSEAGERVYFANYCVHSAADFGAAQDRHRLFIIGVRCDVAEPVGIASDEDVLSVFPEPTHLAANIRSALAGLEQTEEDIRPWRASMATSALSRVVRQLPRSPRRIVRPSQIGLRPDRQFTLSRCAWGLPAPTLTVMGQRPGGLSGAIHPEEDRKFTLPELKRLTGLPDDFVLTGTLVQAAERICRMVPPPLMAAVARSIHERVLRPFRETVR